MLISYKIIIINICIMLICCTLPCHQMYVRTYIVLDEQTHAQLCGFEKLITIWTCKKYINMLSNKWKSQSDTHTKRERAREKLKCLRFKQIRITTRTYSIVSISANIFFPFDVQKKQKCQNFCSMIRVGVSEKNMFIWFENKWTFDKGIERENAPHEIYTKVASINFHLFD